MARRTMILSSSPEQNTMNIQIAQNTHPLPKSSLATSKIKGSPYRAAFRMSQDSGKPPPELWEHDMPCIDLDKYEDIKIMNVILTASEGWNVMNPRDIHDLEPLTEVPSPGIYTRSRRNKLRIYMIFSRSIKYL